MVTPALTPPQASPESLIIGIAGDEFPIADPIETIENAIFPGARLPAGASIKAAYSGIGKRVITAAMRRGVPTIIYPAPDLTNAEDEKPIYDMNHRTAKNCDVLIIFKSGRPATSTENIIRFARKMRIGASLTTLYRNSESCGCTTFWTK